MTAAPIIAARGVTRRFGGLVALVSTYRGAGVGSSLLEAALERARSDGWKRLWLVTSNDNTEAIRMYQRAGWDWVDFRRDAITRARAIKSEIPELGNHGIPIRPFADG